MGMKKISQVEEVPIVKLLRTWPSSKRLTWESLRAAIVEGSGGRLTVAWTRQALSANESVRTAFNAAKKRKPSEGSADGPLTPDAQILKIGELQSELAEVNERYNALLLRHARLINNVSLLEGGTHLLEDPLPDNTRRRSE